MQENKKVLLINPAPSAGWNYQFRRSYGPPISILSVGTALNQRGYDVKIIDGAQDERYFFNSDNEIIRNRFIFVGISAMTAQVPMALKLSKRIKNISPDIPIVWGGVHPTLFPEQVCRNDSVDIAVIGEGEFTAVDLCESLNNRIGLDNVLGIIYKKNGKVITNPDRPLADINDIPFFNYALLDIESYIEKDRTDVGGKHIDGGPKRRSLPVLSGLGCPYSCRFCIESVLKKKYRRRNALQLAGEIKRLIEKYRINDVSFVDDLFFADKKRFLDFLKLIETEGLKFSWSTNVRANYFQENYLNLDLLKRMQRLGCYHLGLGAESGSQRILNKINKAIVKEQVLNAAKVCKESRINLVMSFMIGFPGETPEEMRETVRFAYQAVSINPENSYINGPNIYRPYPGSVLFEEVVKRHGFRLPDSLEKWNEVYSHNEGYFRLESMPWINKPRLIRVYCFYLFRATSNFVYPNYITNLFFKILKIACRLRVKYNFYYFPIEYFLVEAGRGALAKKRLRL